MPLPTGTKLMVQKVVVEVLGRGFADIFSFIVQMSDISFMKTIELTRVLLCPISTSVNV